MRRFAMGPASWLALSAVALSSPAVAKDGRASHGHGHGHGGAHCDEELSCTALYGPFSSQVGEPCDSPIGLCTHGMLEGELEATYDATFDTMVPANDPSDPSKLLYTGTSVVSALDGSGVIYTEDTGEIRTNPDGTSSFVTKAVIVDGTKSFKKTDGGFVAVGTLNQLGASEGSFSAVLCAPEKHRR